MSDSPSSSSSLQPPPSVDLKAVLDALAQEEQRLKELENVSVKMGNRLNEAQDLVATAQAAAQLRETIQRSTEV